MSEKVLSRSRSLDPDFIESLLHDAPVGLARFDRQMRYVWVNESLARMNGLPVEAHIGRTPNELLPDLDPAALDALRMALETGIVVTGHEFGGETPAAPGERRYWHETYTPILDATGAVAGATAIVIEITARRRDEQRVRQLQAVTEALVTSGATAEVVGRLVAVSADILEAASATLVLRDSPGSLRVAGRTGTVANVLAGWDTFPESLDVPLARVVRTGQPYFASTRAEYVAEFPGLEEAATRTDLGSIAVVPVPLDGGDRGALALSFRTPRFFDSDEQGWAISLGRLSGQAIARAQLGELGARARERAESIARVSIALSAASDPDEVASIILSEGLAALGTRFGGIVLVSDAGDELEVIGASGYADAVGERWRLDERDLVTDAVRRGNPVYVTSSTEYAARYPETADRRRTEGGAAALPLRIGDRTIGAMTVAFGESRPFDRDERSYMETLAGTCAQALDRARAHEAERQSRERAERIARVTARLADAPDPRSAATIIVEEASDLLGTSRATLVLTRRGKVEPLATTGYAGVDADDLVAAMRLPESPLGEAVRSAQQSVVRPSDTPEAAAELVELCRRAGDEAFVVTPLTVRGRRLGALVLACADARALNASVLASLDALSDAAAQALDRATLREAEETARRTLESVVRQMPVAVIVADANARLIEANDELYAMWRLDPASKMPRSDDWAGFDRHGRRLGIDEWPLGRSIRSGEIVGGEEIEIERFDGTRASIVNSSAPIRDESGRIIGGVAIFTDVTDAREAAAARDAFLGVLSHELRTPVTSILAGSKIVLGRDATLSTTTREVLEGIATDADRLQRLVEDLLVLAKVERGGSLVETEPILLQHLTRRVVDAQQAAWPDVRFTLTAPVGLPVVSGDEGYIEQVLRNLTGNGAKYGGGSVDVIVENRGGEVAVRVLDDGIGFDPGAADHMFELFYRAPDATRRAPGAGIGLYVVRQLVAAMRGRVWAANRESGGAEFGFALRVHDESSDLAPEPIAEDRR